MAQDRGTILQAGRRKAYRPLPAAERDAARCAAIEAWERGDWFETHELLEPAWMGSADAGERLRDQAVIKLAAAFVHLARGNRAGVRTNLVGARARAADAVAKGVAADRLAAALEGLVEVVDDASVPLAAVEPPDLRAVMGPRWTASD